MWATWQRRFTGGRQTKKTQGRPAAPGGGYESIRKLRPELSALIELGLLFVPALPAFIWLWPNLSDAFLGDLVQSLVYVYIFGGVLFIGLRRWTWSQLGVNRQGVGLSLACSALFIVVRLLGQVAAGQSLQWRPFAPGRLAWELFFFFGLVGGVEELLYRGLLFRLLADWRGPGAAIFGSALGFALWHIGWMGPLIFAPFLIGLLFGLIRWRAGGVVGLVLGHGLFDLVSAELKTPLTVTTLGQLGHLTIANPLAAVSGDVLLLALVLYLWKIHPWLDRRSPTGERPAANGER